MIDDTPHWITHGRQLVRDLRDPRPTPPQLRPSVLERCGIRDAYAPIETPIGSLFVAYNGCGISMIRQADERTAFEQHFNDRVGRAIRYEDHLPPALQHAILARINGSDEAALAFDLRKLSPFERAVLRKAAEIPRGEVRPYAWIAREIDHPKAVRAVGTALGHNPLPLLIPCHRVVRTDGHLGHYIFGDQIKRTILDQEGAAPDLIEQLADAGVRYLGDPDDGSFCLPTCGGMHQRISPRWTLFRSDKAALASGLEPCRNCRPMQAAGYV